MRKLILLCTMLFAAPLLAANSTPLRSAAELKTLVGPIALYPDDLVAVVLPAAAYPLQLVQAERAADNDDRPDADWDEAVVAIMNYPEVLEFLNDDLDWTHELGLVFINQEADVFAAIQSFRADALAAGNLKSDQYQTVSVDRSVITIKQRDVEKIYVPYYQPREVIVRHVYPVYHYYPVARPVYYYPYPAHYAFNVGHFYGVGTYFSIGWHYRGLSLSYSTHAGHPYWGIAYSPRHYYFKPRYRPRLHARHRHHYKPDYYKPVRHKVVHRKAPHRAAHKPHKVRKAHHKQQKRAERRREHRADWREQRRVDKRHERRIDKRHERRQVAQRQDQQPKWQQRRQNRELKREQRPTRKTMARAERNSPQTMRQISRTEQRINRARHQAQRRVAHRQVGKNRMGTNRTATNRAANNRTGMNRHGGNRNRGHRGQR